MLHSFSKIFFFIITAVICFSVSDYDLDALRNAGPFEVSFKYNIFTFNFGVVVPDSESTGEPDCDVVDTQVRMAQQVCYGKVENTTYLPLPDGGDGVLITSKAKSMVSLMYVRCSSEILIYNYSYDSSVGFNVVILSPLGCAVVDTANYDLDSIGKNGPYEVEYDGNLVVTFSVGETVPNAALSGDGNCSVLCVNKVDASYVCYGSTTNTEYIHLSNSDGFLAVASSHTLDPDEPDNDLRTYSYVYVFCDVSQSITNSSIMLYKNFTAELHTPFGCRREPPPGPGDDDGDPSDRSRKGAVVTAVVLSVLFSLLFVGVVVTVVVCVVRKRRKGYTEVK